MSEGATPLYRFLAPRYWPVWLGVSAMRATCLLPYRVQLGLGRGAGWLLYRLARERRRVAAKNIALCFPELERARRERLLRAHFDSLGIALFEIAMSWWLPSRRLRPLAELHGLEYAQEALGAGRGAILLSAHQTCLEIGCRLLRPSLDFHPMYRRHENPLFQEIMRRSRERHSEVAIRKDDVRQMLRSLKANHAVWYAPDQAYRGKGGALVPFFSIPAPTNTGTSRLARISGAPVIPFFMQRKRDGSGYRLELRPPLADFPSEDPVDDAAHINRVIEEQVREAPEQYLWVHKRFKPLDPAGPDPYAGTPPPRE